MQGNTTKIIVLIIVIACVAGMFYLINTPEALSSVTAWFESKVN